MIANLVTSIGVMMIPVGFLLGTIENFNKGLLWLIGIIGFGALFYATQIVKQEEQKRDQRFKELIDEIRKLRKDNNSDILR